MSAPTLPSHADAGRLTMAALLTSQPDNCAPTPAAITGCMPPYLRGKLLRNGPSQWARLPLLPPPPARLTASQEVGDSQLLHWFDGFAAIHAFEMDGQGGVVFRYIDHHGDAVALL